MRPLRDDFAALVGREADCGLARGALEIARIAYPALEPAPYLNKLDELAEGARARMAGGLPPEAVARAVGDHLFRTCGFRGNAEDYYDPRNSFLNDVLDRRTGIPISLSVVFIEVNRRLGVAAEGVGFGKLPAAPRGPRPPRPTRTTCARACPASPGRTRHFIDPGGPSSARAAAPRCALPMPPDPAPGSAQPRPASGIPGPSDPAGGTAATSSGGQGRIVIRGWRRRNTAAMAAAAIRLPTSTDCQATACSTGSAKNAEKRTNPNSKMTKSSTTPKPKSGLRSATAPNRAAAPPMCKNSRTCTHVNATTSSRDGE